MPAAKKTFAQPLAALPPYGCGIPLAGTSARSLAPSRPKCRRFAAVGLETRLRAQSFPTATRCAGLAVGVPPCGRLFSETGNIDIGLLGSDGVDVNVLNDWATDPSATHVAVTPAAAELEELFAELAANISKTGATNIPEDLDVSGGSTRAMCNPRRFRARFIAHNIDTDFRCCEAVVTV